MNRKLKRIWRSATALCMAFVMMFSTCSTVFAQEDGSVDAKKKYVSLGDSMTNGYGLTDYEPSAGNVNGYLQVSPDAYPAKVAKAMDWDLTQLAISAMRAEDLHFILEFDYTDENAFKVATKVPSDDDYTKDKKGDNYKSLWWNEVQSNRWNETFSVGDYYTWDEFTDGRFDDYSIIEEGYDVDDYAKKFQTSVADADVISIGTGNSNFGVFMLHRLLASIGFDGTPEDTAWIDFERALAECDPETKAKIMTLKASLDDALEAELAVLEGTEAEAMVDSLIRTVTYTAVSYVLNYAGVLERIMELNPDAEVILVGIMNTMAGLNLSYTDENGNPQILPMENVLGVIVEPVNAYIAALPAAMQAAGNGMNDEATFYYAEAPVVDVVVNNYVEEFEKDNKTIRNRFVTEIVGEEDDGKFENGMVWDLVAPMFDKFVENYGLKLTAVNCEQVATYEKFATEWEAYTKSQDDSSNSAPEEPKCSTLNDSEILSAAIYLAFEDTVKAASTEATLSVDAIKKLADLENSGLFDGVAEQLKSKLDMNGIAQKVAIAAGNDQSKIPYYVSRYLSAEITDVLASALQDDVTLMGLFHLFGRMLIGNGLGAHPSAKGHDELTAAILASYGTYTAKDATIDKALEALEIISDVVAEYYDEAYAYAYDYAEAEGYIAGASAALDEVNASLDEVAAWVAANGDISGEYEATILKEIEDAKATIAALKDLINNADELDAETYEKAIALLDSLYPHLTNISQLLDTAASDLTEAAKAELEKLGKAVWAEYLEAKKYVEENFPIALGKAYEFIVEKAGDAFEVLADAAAQAVAEYGPEAVAWVYDYLLNNPAEVIAFFREYGDDAVAFVKEYQDEIFAVLGFLVSTFGDDVADYVMEHPEEVLKTMCELVQEYGDEAWALIVVYAKELGLTEKMPTTEDIKDALDTIYDLLKEYGPGIYDWAEKEGYIDALEDAVEALKKAIEEEIQDYIENVRPEIEKAIEALKAELKALEAELEALKAQLENASEELKAEIEVAIEMIEAKIAEIKAAIEALEAKLAQIAEELNTLYEAIVELAEAIAELIDISTGKLEGEFNAAIEKVQNAYDKVVAAIEAAKELAEIVNTVMAEAAELAEAIAEQIAALKAAACEALEAIKDAIAAGAEELISQYEEELQAIKDALEAIGEEVWAEAQAKIAELQAALEEEIAALKAALEEEIAALKAKAEEQIAALKAAAEAEIAKIKAELEAKIAELEAALENAAEEAKAAILAQIEALKAEAEAKIAEIQAALEAEIEAILAEVEAQIEALKAEVEAKIAEITEAVEKQIAEIIAAAEAKIAELKAAAEEAAKEVIAELEKAIAEVKAKAEELIAEVEAAVQEILDAVDAEITKAAEAVMAEAIKLAENAIAFIEEKINEVIAAYEEAYIGATTGEYTVSEDSYYVSIGDSAVTGLGLGRNEVPFGDRLAEALGLDLDTQFAQLGQDGLRAEDLRYILDETYVPDAYGAAVVGDDAASLRSAYEAEIAKADLITVGIGNDNISLFVTAQLQRALANRKLYDMDWNRYLGEAGTAYVMEELEGIRADLKESGLDDFTAGLVLTAVESYAYGYVGFAFNYAEALNRIHEINPEALVIVVGTFNPIDDMVIDVNGTEVAIGDLANGLVELSNLHFTIYAMLTPGTTFVTIPDTENFMDEAIAEGEYEDVTMMSYIMALLANEMHANADGHEYIKNRILNALTVNHDYLLGDVNLDGRVTDADVNLLYRYVNGYAELTDLQKQIGNVNNDDRVTDADVNLLYRYVNGCSMLN